MKPTSVVADAAVAQAPALTTWRVIDPLSHDQVDYAVGATVDLTEAQAAPLLRLRCIAAPVDESVDEQKPEA